ncbi:hypothetical protein [Leisingera aquaemixtae]|uniref:hypothetical protein n=1 Tax=Leisingera aquaemixtae TaxID=1396826 RepID=UPI0011AE90DB|nr:hypothetical protein [Leisingera aquaemixtae]
MLCAAIGLTGCSPDNLFVAHETVVGVNAKVSADRQQGQLVVGYDRDFVTIVPTTVEGDNGGREAMALLSCTELAVQGIYLAQYTDITATGAAAARLGKAIDEKGSAAFDCDGDS